MNIIISSLDDTRVVGASGNSDIDFINLFVAKTLGKIPIRASISCTIKEDDFDKTIENELTIDENPSKDKDAYLAFLFSAVA
jgi:hypothetical protein